MMGCSPAEWGQAEAAYGAIASQIEGLVMRLTLELRAR